MLSSSVGCVCATVPSILGHRRLCSNAFCIEGMVKLHRWATHNDTSSNWGDDPYGNEIDKFAGDSQIAGSNCNGPLCLDCNFAACHHCNPDIYKQECLAPEILKLPFGETIVG